MSLLRIAAGVLVCGCLWAQRSGGAARGALVIDDGGATAVVKDHVAIYDNQRHSGAWYSGLTPGDHFDLASWHKVDP
jgi:hypothetical protein